MKLVRRHLPRAAREDFWRWLDEMAATAAASGTDEGRNLLGVLGALSVYRGTKQGDLAERGYAATVALVTWIYACVPIPRRLTIYDKVSGREYSAVMVGWLAWALIWGDTSEALAAICQCAGCAAVRQREQAVVRVVMPPPPPSSSGPLE